MMTDHRREKFHPQWVNPTAIKDRFWLYVDGPPHLQDCESYGKWVVTQPLEDIDKTWRVVGNAVQSGQLESLEAKCSTLRYNPDCFGPGPVTISSICVYTTKENIDKVGRILIELVRHDIYYKTDEATSSGVYAHTGAQNSILKTLYWNSGEPSFELKGEISPGWSQQKQCSDSWLLNHVKSTSEALLSDKVYGKWVVKLDYDEVTEFWHRLKERIESGELGAMEMVCPPKVKLHDPEEKPLFHIFTSQRKKDEVGSKLVKIFKSDLVYEIKSETL